jgi:hypothetical protein
MYPVSFLSQIDISLVIIVLCNKSRNITEWFIYNKVEYYCILRLCIFGNIIYRPVAMFGMNSGRKALAQHKFSEGVHQGTQGSPCFAQGSPCFAPRHVSFRSVVCRKCRHPRKAGRALGAGVMILSRTDT